MARIEIRESAELTGSAEHAYSILADYHHGHPSILPSRHFTHLRVLEGGRGHGTVIQFGLKLGGRVQEAVADVTEPEPGRTLVERVRDDRGTETTFTVESAGASRVHVTIHTRFTARGLPGWVERLVAPRLLRPIYRQQLAHLGRALAADGSPPEASG
jgi:hypothetical protein